MCSKTLDAFSQVKRHIVNHTRGNTMKAIVKKHKGPGLQLIDVDMLKWKVMRFNKSTQKRYLWY